MGHVEEMHERAVQANNHLVKALTAGHSPPLQALSTLAALHEVIAAIHAIYLYIESEQPNRIELLQRRSGTD
jgi:hypothetical protein